MELTEVTLSAFKDELEKIAGGFSRSGIRPYKADTLLKHTGRFVKRNFMTKKSGVKSTLAIGATGAAAALYGERKLKKAVDDYRMGREIRKQQGG
jgi:hypothetical protein